MAGNVFNGTGTNTSKENVFPVSQCIPWLIVFIIEYLAIIILNLITIIVLIKNHKLQRRSTYLIIHLAIVDLLVGAVSGPEKIKWMGSFCNLWSIGWKNPVLSLVFSFVFPLASLVNLTAISLERAHATFCPFKHRFMKKWVYAVIIILTWLIVTAWIGIIMMSNDFLIHFMMFSSFFILMSVTIVSYVSIFVKVRFHRQLRHSNTARERKLTSTLFIVTIGSAITWFPLIIYLVVFHPHSAYNITRRSLFHIERAAAVLFMANSVINPIIYAMRMPELRQGIMQIIFRRNPIRLNLADIPLR